MAVSRADAEAQLQAHLWEATPWGQVRNILSEPPPHGEVRQPPPDLGLVHVMIIRFTGRIETVPCIGRSKCTLRLRIGLRMKEFLSTLRVAGDRRLPFGRGEPVGEPMRRSLFSLRTSLWVQQNDVV
jgi:hypothetical protein